MFLFRTAWTSKWLVNMAQDNAWFGQGMAISSMASTRNEQHTAGTTLPVGARHQAWNGASCGAALCVQPSADFHSTF